MLFSANLLLNRDLFRTLGQSVKLGTLEALLVKIETPNSQLVKQQKLFSVGDNEKTIFQLVRMKKKLIFSCRPGGGKMTNRDPC